MTGRLLLVGRLLVRDLRRRRTEALLLVFAIAAATGTLTLGMALNGIATRPYAKTKVATGGPDLVVLPIRPGQESLAALTPLASAPGVTGHSGPYPLAFLLITAHGRTVHVVVEGRDQAAAPVDQPAIADGRWVRPGGVVVERFFAEALGVHTGDTVSVGGHRLRVTGTAVTAAFAEFPHPGWHDPGDVLSSPGGLVWVDRGDFGTIAGGQPPSYALNLTLADPSAGEDVIARLEVPSSTRTAQFIAAEDDRLTADARASLLIGSWLLTGLALAGVAGIVAGRIIGRRRRVGLLKAVGAGPGLIASVQLGEYLVIGFVAGGLGLAAGWLTAPRLFGSSAGLVGAADAGAPPVSTVVVAIVVALAIAVVATLVPVIRAVTTSTVHALADAATPPRRRRWRIRFSRRLPIALLLGVRINARRPRRARLVTVNTLITTTTLAAALTARAQVHTLDNLGGSQLADPRGPSANHALLLVGVVACTLALFNTVVSTWTAVLDARQPLAVARALGATPGQAGIGLAVAQLLPALLGVVIGTLTGVWFSAIAGSDNQAAPASWMLTMGLTVLVAVTALTAVPALAAARRPVADTLRSAPG